MRPALQQLDPSDEAAIDDYHRVAEAVRAGIPSLPPLTRTQTAGRIRYPRPATEVTRFVARVAGVPAAILQVSLPMADNTRSVLVDLGVHPDLRRRGLGRELFERTVEFARGHGRSLLIGEYCTDLPDGGERVAGPAAFAVAMGARPALPERHRRLDLATVDRGAWRAAYDEARTQAKGYSVLWWSGAVPEGLLADVAYLESRMGDDAPTGELDYEAEKFDAERMRATDEVLRLRGTAQYHAGARDDATGALVAWSVLNKEADDSAHAWQSTTIVDPQHRGHRLGLLVKLENLIRTSTVEPGLRHVHTWNADENAHMVAINETIGFQPIDAWVTWQYDLPVTT